MIDNINTYDFGTFWAEFETEYVVLTTSRACFSWHLQKLLWRAQAYTYSSFLTVVWGLPQPLGCNVSNAPTMGGQGSGPWGLIGYTTIDQRSAPWCLLLLGLLILRNSCMHRKWGVKNVPHKSTTLSSCSYILLLLNQQQPCRWTTTIIYLFFYTSNFFRVWFR